MRCHINVSTTRYAEVAGLICLRGPNGNRRDWAEHSREVHNQKSNGKTTVLNAHHATNDDKLAILREQVKTAVKILKGLKSKAKNTILAEFPVVSFLFQPSFIVCLQLPTCA